MNVKNIEGTEVYTIIEFCVAHQLSKSSFYRMVKNGTAPKIMHVGRRCYVSVYSATQWRIQSEQ